MNTPNPFLTALGAKFKKPVKERRWPSPLAMANALEGLSMPHHQRYIDERLVAMADGKLDKVAVSLPPQSGKSTLTTLWLVLWLLDTDPDLRLVVISYNSDYASSWGREAKRMIDKHADTLGWGVSPDSKANGLWRVKGHGGGCMYIGVGGGLTGWTVHWVINDDWIKGIEDGFNSEAHTKNFAFHQAVVEQRLQHGVKEICNMTRWAEDDLIGQLTAHAPDEWEVINLPAKAEEGDVLGRPIGQGLWLEKNPQEWYDKKEAGLSSFIWAGLYQQRPAPAGGGILKKVHFRYFETLPATETSDRRERWMLQSGEYVDPDECVRFGIADTASSTRTSADFTVLGAFALTPKGDLLVIDIQRVRIEEDGQANMIAAFLFRNRLPWIGVEQTFSTSGLANQLGQLNIPFRGIKADTDKLTRALPLRTRLEMHRLHFRGGAPWLADLENEMLMFPRGKHDDQVDVLAYAARHLDTSAVGSLRSKPTGRRRRTDRTRRAVSGY